MRGLQWGYSTQVTTWGCILYGHKQEGNHNHETGVMVVKRNVVEGIWWGVWQIPFRYYKKTLYTPCNYKVCSLVYIPCLYSVFPLWLHHWSWRMMLLFKECLISCCKQSRFHLWLLLKKVLIQGIMRSINTILFPVLCKVGRMQEINQIIPVKLKMIVPGGQRHMHMQSSIDLFEYVCCVF